LWGLQSIIDNQGGLKDGCSAIGDGDKELEEPDEAAKAAKTAAAAEAAAAAAQAAAANQRPLAERFPLKRKVLQQMLQVASGSSAHCLIQLIEAGR
jgi:hypothetical protein